MEPPGPASGENTPASSHSGSLPPAPGNARLELVIEGGSRFCEDGTVIGTKGNLPPDFLRPWPDLEPRHLLLGLEGARWFIFTPLTVMRPFSLDGEPLKRGERRALDRVRHHLALDHVRIGLRLHPAEGSLRGGLRRFFGARQRVS